MTIVKYDYISYFVAVINHSCVIWYSPVTEHKSSKDIIVYTWVKSLVFYVPMFSMCMTAPQLVQWMDGLIFSSWLLFSESQKDRNIRMWLTTTGTEVEWWWLSPQVLYYLIWILTKSCKNVIFQTLNMNWQHFLCVSVTWCHVVCEEVLLLLMKTI